MLVKKKLLLAGLALLLTGSFDVRAAAVPRVPSRPASREYVRVTSWAAANNLQVRWLKREDNFVASNSSRRIGMKVDSREAQVDGIEVRLLFPIMSRDGQAWISQTDIQTTFRPILEPPKIKSGSSIKNICLDPGHGGKDPGNHLGSHEEKKYNLLLAQELKSQLTSAGFKVTLTRTSDKFIELPDRPQIARSRNADLFICLHFNAFPQTSVRGTEVYCLTPTGAPSTNARGEGGGSGPSAGNRMNAQNMLLAYHVQKALIKNLGTEDRGVHRARFAVLRDAVMPAILVEGGFMSHPVEGRRIFDPAYRRQMAKAITDGVLAYKRQVASAT
jgi:N-acetylmuramoyl-L-alanine amidase